MICGSPREMCVLAVRSLLQANRRGVIVGSWAKHDVSMLKDHTDSETTESYAEGHILFVEFAPHELLFPKCSVLVHHGGPGTLAAGLRSGIPQVITPVFLDQPINANALQESGCGLRAASLAKLTPAELAEAIQTCGADEKSRATARVMGDKISAEGGVAKAVEIVGRWISGELDTGKWRQKFEAREQEFEEARKGWFFQAKFKGLPARSPGSIS